MPDPKPALPRQIGRWLASDDPELQAKAEAALQAVESDANDLLLERAIKEQNHISALLTAIFFAPLLFCVLVYTLFNSAPPVPHHLFERICYEIIPFGLTVIVAMPLIAGLMYLFVVPLQARRRAICLKLAQREDDRAVPFLLSSRFDWPDTSPRVENALIALTQNAMPGSVPLSYKAHDKDPAYRLRHTVDEMTRKQKGATFFKMSATLDARRIQVWLALLPHLAADSNPKSQAVLANLLDAQAKTLEEEYLQNTVRALLAPTTITEPTYAPATSDTLAVWKPAETHDTPTVLQRRLR